jgi:hypothetical protein
MSKTHSPNLKLVTPILIQFGTNFKMTKHLIELQLTLDRMLFDAK